MEGDKPQGKKAGRRPGGRGRGGEGAAAGARPAAPARGPRAKRAGGQAAVRPAMRRRRMFDGGDLRLVMLSLIKDQPRHGYELIKAIEEMTGGNYAPSPGVVYPSLTMLQEMDQVAAEEAADGRRRFTITAAGREQLAAAGEKAQGLIGRLTNVGAEQGKAESVSVRRAMSNFRVAVQDRLSRGELPEETLQQIAALIDEVAAKIEKLA